VFMVNMVNDLVARGLLARRHGRWRVEGSIDEATEQVPVGLQELIALRLEQFDPDERRTLEAASVAGDVYVVASVAAALEEPVETIEARCERLAAQGLMISEAGVAEWPDGTISGLYRFQHALYRHVLYQGIAEMRRVRLHRAVGLREEAAYGPHAKARAAQLAMHFSRGRERPRALAYHQMAAEAALDRDAPREAVTHCGAALEALAHTEAAAGRGERELQLVVMRATLLMATRGYAAPETVRDFARARALCRELPESPDINPVLRGLLSYHHVRAELSEAHDLGELMLAHARDNPGDTALRVQAHYGHGATLFHQGAFSAAATHLEAARREYDPAQHATHARVYGGYDPGVACCMWGAWALALQGRLGEAAALDREGLALARRLPDAFTLAWACHGAGATRQIVGDWPASEALAAEAMQLAEEHGFPHVLGMAMVNRGWALIMQGRAPAGIAMLREGVAAVEATGAALMHSSYLGMLAAAEAWQGDRAAALRCFDEGLREAQLSGERMHVAPLLIAKSHLLVRGGAGGRTSRAVIEEAEECLRHAIEMARRQGARLVELRAAVALARHCDRQGRDDEGRAVLAAAHAWFADRGEQAPDIATARQLLAS
jgi:tetratricopeptide (TPR) repeat protein